MSSISWSVILFLVVWSTVKTWKALESGDEQDDEMVFEGISSIAYGSRIVSFTLLRTKFTSKV